MANNVTLSIVADTTDLRTNLKLAEAEVKSLNKTFRDLQTQGQTSGLTAGMRTDLTATANALTVAENKVVALKRELASVRSSAGGLSAVGSGAKEAGKAMEGLHFGTAGVTRELIVLGREASRANFSRMAGSATILLQRMGLLTPAVLMGAAAVAALAAPFIAVGMAMDGAAADLAKFKNATALTGNFAGLTAQQYENMARRIATASNVGVGAARTTLLGLASSGRFSSDELLQLGRDAGKMSQLTGTASKEVLADFIKMGDGPTSFAETFNRTHHAFSLAQMEEIRLLEDHGQKSQATAALVRDLTAWLDHQTVHLGPLAGAWHSVTTATDNAWQSWERFIKGPDLGAKLATAKTLLAQIKTTGENPMGLDVGALEKKVAALQKVADAERAGADATANAARIQAEGNDAYEKSHETFRSLRSSAIQAREAVKALHDEMAARLKANPKDAEAQDYMANQGRYDKALMHKMDPKDNPKDKAPPDIVSTWSEQLHAQEVASGEFFKDQTDKELAFWKGKVGLVAAGSKDWLAVQAKIFESAKAIAHQGYADQVAAMNDKIQADKDNWSKETSDWSDKLAFIRKTHGEESSEYQNAHREFEAAEREHQKQMADLQRAAAADQFNVLKSHLEANRAIREADAKTAESAITAGAKYNPVVGEVQAAQQIAAIHRQLNDQELADEAHLAAAKARQLAEDIASYPKDSEAYKKAVKAKEAADQEWAEKLRTLANKSANQQIADQQRIAQTWHSTIDPMVSSVGSQFKGLIEGTENWKQALAHIADSALNMVIQALEKVVEKQIVTAIMAATTQKASAASQVAANAGVAGAAGVASMAAAPFPLDLGAPAFGAEMAATAMAFGSFDKGTNMVPSDMVAQIHAGERIIPAADNKALMAAVGGGGGGSGGKGGVVNNHINYAPQVTNPGKSFAQQLQDHAGDLHDLIRTAFRNGSLSFG